MDMWNPVCCCTTNAGKHVLESRGADEQPTSAGDEAAEEQCCSFQNDNRAPKDPEVFDADPFKPCPQPQTTGLQAELEPTDDFSNFLASLPEVAEGTVTLEFNTRIGVIQTVTITELPFGAVFRNDMMPLTVVGVQPGSAAAKAGVEEGWQCRSVNGRAVMDISYRVAMDAFMMHMSPLPLVIEFATASGARAIHFRKRPLQMWFNKVMPIIVTKVSRGGHADELGVETGWQVTAVGGIRLQGLDYAAADKLLQAGLRSLPDITEKIS